MITLIIILTLLSAGQQDNPAYRIFDQEGNSSNFAEFIETARQSEMIFFGELHNNPISHWLRQEIFDEIHQTDDRSLLIGAEMFERDDQLILDEYLKDWTAENNFEDEAKLWSNYDTDYKPMVQWAKEHEVPLIATNIPRRYAAMVNHNGLDFLDTLDQRASEYIAPLPLEVDMELKSYQEMMDMGGHHGTENLVKAQAIKDATMAHSILEHFDEDRHRLIHINGAFHTRYNEGIIWYLEQENPEISTLTISTVEQQQTDSLETRHHDVADFLLVVPDNMTKTH